MSKTRLLYRADGGHPVGMGHIMRALRVTKELSQLLDLDVLLVSRENPAVHRLVVKENPPYVKVHWLPAVEDSIIPVLGGREFLKTADEYKPDVIVIDALDTPEEEMCSIARLGSKLVTQDDRGLGRICADLIVNFLVTDPNPSVLRSKTLLLQGPEYAPLADDYIGSSAKRRKTEPEKVKTVTVTMGGADAVGLAIKVAEALVMIPDLEKVNFNIGPAFQKKEELERMVKQARWHAEILVNVPSLLPVFLDSDLAIVAGGITMHETACCGVPAVAVCQPIDHQLFVADRLQDAGAMLNLGYGIELDAKDIARAVVDLSENREKRQAMAEVGPKTVDGRGSRRVAEAIAGVLKGNTPQDTRRRPGSSSSQ